MVFVIFTCYFVLEIFVMMGNTSHILFLGLMSFPLLYFIIR